MPRVVCGLLTVALLGSSAWADVIPSQYPDREAGRARRVVAERFQALGLSEDQAASRVRGILDDDARYFAENPVRVQLAGDEQVSGFPTVAFLEGALMLGLAAAIWGWRWSVVRD